MSAPATSAPAARTAPADLAPPDLALADIAPADIAADTEPALAAVRLHSKAITRLAGLIAAIRPDQWTLLTPCAEWDVRALVDHLVTEARWTPPLLAGLTVAEVGSSLHEALDPDPVVAWAVAQQGALTAARGPQVAQTIVHVSAGDIPAQEYLHQLTGDYLVHGWDLAVTLGLDDSLDPELVAAVSTWFRSCAESYRNAGMVAAAVPVVGNDPQTMLLAEFGRSRTIEATRAAVARFSNAFDRSDVDAVMAAMTSDCVFESTAPPDGHRHVGQPDVRQAWADFFAASGAAVFETEELIVCDDRAIVRWRYTWASDAAGHVRGIDVFRIRDGLVAEKLSYVKG